tara:strand:- start:245 stop:610 length:366 start_codon:yes stop_codon:yes gene_type:complete
MYSSEVFGRLFWVDDNYEFKSCPLFDNGTGDFDNTDYVSEWDDFTDVDIPLLLNIQKFCIHNKINYAGALTHKEVNSPKKEEDKMLNYEWNEDFYKEIVIDYQYRFPKFDVNNYPIHLTQH